LRSKPWLLCLIFSVILFYDALSGYGSFLRFWRDSYQHPDIMGSDYSLIKGEPETINSISLYVESTIREENNIAFVTAFNQALLESGLSAYQTGENVLFVYSQDYDYQKHIILKTGDTADLQDFFEYANSGVSDSQSLVDPLASDAFTILPLQDLTHSERNINGWYTLTGTGDIKLKLQLFEEKMHENFPDVVFTINISKTTFTPFVMFSKSDFTLIVLLAICTLLWVSSGVLKNLADITEERQEGLSTLSIWGYGILRLAIVTASTYFAVNLIGYFLFIGTGNGANFFFIKTLLSFLMYWACLLVFSTMFWWVIHYAPRDIKEKVRLRLVAWVAGVTIICLIFTGNLIANGLSTIASLLSSFSNEREYLGKINQLYSTYETKLGYYETPSDSMDSVVNHLANRNGFFYFGKITTYQKANVYSTTPNYFDGIMEVDVADGNVLIVINANHPRSYQEAQEILALVYGEAMSKGMSFQIKPVDFSKLTLFETAWNYNRNLGEYDIILVEPLDFSYLHRIFEDGYFYYDGNLAQAQNFLDSLCKRMGAKPAIRLHSLHDEYLKSRANVLTSFEEPILFLLLSGFAMYLAISQSAVVLIEYNKKVSIIKTLWERIRGGQS